MKNVTVCIHFNCETFRVMSIAGVNLLLSLSLGEFVDIGIFFISEVLVDWKIANLSEKKFIYQANNEGNNRNFFFFVLIFHPSHGCIVIKQREFCLHRHWMKCEKRNLKCCISGKKRFGISFMLNICTF